ncbi:NUDIX domain-containing protein [Sphingomonas sp. ASV193]|uniref:NUDIX hydrolase n=1 Tax=Sphingomonas sp. ASV193 TaxID=3144405 RepID=UPI0032E85668
MSDDDAIPAATLVVMTADPVPRLLMVERAAKMAFAAGMWVFPGGRVDPEDMAIADRLGLPGEGARVAALRETIEESGIAPGLGLADADARSLQSALHRGTSLADQVDVDRLRAAITALTPFARWKPSFAQPRKFDTMFYLAASPSGPPAPRPQPGECVAAEWVSARAMLDRIAAGSARAIFPTKRNLERLACFDGLDEAVADARAFPVDTIVPWIEPRDGKDHVVIPADRGYPVTSEPLASAFRR